MRSEREMRNLHVWSFWLIFSQFGSKPLKSQQYFHLFAKQASFHLTLKLCLIDFHLQLCINTTSNSAQPPVTPPHCTTQEMRSLTPTTVRNLTYQATMLANSDYSPSTRIDIQKTYLRGSLAKINSKVLAKDYLTQIHQAELQRAARRKRTVRVVQKRGVITVSKA